jgi:DNA polymerase III subunit beta
MKLSIKREPLEKILKNLSEAIPVQTPEVNLKNFLFTVTDTTLTILSSDGMLSMETVIELNKPDSIVINSIPGTIQIPASILVDAIKKLKTEIITLDLVDETILYLTDENTNFKLKVVAANEYPSIDMDTSSKEPIQIKMSDFCDLYNATYFATATKGSKELFCGINIAAKNDKLTFVATDSYRLARKYIPLPGNYLFSITVPSKALSVVSHISNFDTISMYIENNKVLFKVGIYTISSKLYAGEFPNIDRIIPTNIAYKLTVNSKEFIDAIETILVINNFKVKVSCETNGKVEISTNNVTTGYSNTFVKNAKYEGNDNFVIIFNSAYVIEAIKALNQENVTLEFVSDSRAFLVSGDDQTITQVVTPIRTLSD